MMSSILLRASLDGGVLVAAIWALCRLMPRLGPATRALLWWCATAKFVLALVWIAPVALPVLPSSDESPQAVELAAEPQTALSTVADEAMPRARALSSSTTIGQRAWSAALVAWCAGVAAACGIGWLRWRKTRGVVERSAAAPEHVGLLARELAARLGLRRVPDVRLSGDIQSPLVAGVIRPIVVLPEPRFLALTERQQQMALCHELAHVRRGDLWLGCAPALAERLFFFHPLVHLAAREYAFWREAACDSVVIDLLDAAPRDYGRLLLDLGISPTHGSLAAAGAAWSFSNLKRRIVMLGDPSSRALRSRAVASTTVSFAMAAMVPMQLVERQSPARLGDSGRQQTEALSNASAPREAQEQRNEPKLNYVLFVDDNHTTSSGSMDDIKNARRFKRPGERLLWFRESGREYVVRDPSILQQVEALWMPVNEIGAKQGKVGHAQGALGAKQGDLGAKQGLIGAEQGKIGARQGELGAQQAAQAARESRATSRAEMDAIARSQRDLDQQMRALDEQMTRLDDRMRELDEPMRELDRQMRLLDKDMQQLDREMQGAVAQAEAEMRSILDRTIATGAATLVK